MKRSLSQSDQLEKRVCRRRCVVADCPNVPDVANAKCATCSTVLCSNRLCTNPCKEGLRGRKLKKCDEHSKKGTPRRWQAKESLTQGMSFTQSKVVESQQERSMQQAKIVRQFSQRGVIEQEIVTSSTETLTQTWRQKIVDCTHVWSKTEYERLVGGADFDETAVAFPAIRIAYRDAENKFEDVHNCEGAVNVAAGAAVIKLRDLHTKALASIQIQDSWPAHQKNLLKQAKESGALPGTLVPCDLLLMLTIVKKAIYQTCERKDFHPLYMIYSAAEQVWASLLSNLEDFYPQFDQSSPVNRVFEEQYHYYQHINDLIGPRPEETEPPPNPHVHRGFLFPKAANMSAAVTEPQQPNALNKPQKNGLPLPNDTPDLLCGFTRSHFTELGTVLGFNGAEVYRTLTFVNNLQTRDEELFSLVLSAQLMVRFAQSRQSKADLSSITVLETLPDGGQFDVSYVASPCVWMHRGITDHGNPCARIRLTVDNKQNPPPVKIWPSEIECNVFLPHQCMLKFIEQREKDPMDRILTPQYQRARQMSTNRKVRRNWAQIKADTNRFMFGIPLHSRLLNHPAFEPLRAYTDQQTMAE